MVQQWMPQYILWVDFIIDLNVINKENIMVYSTNQQKEKHYVLMERKKLVRLV